MCGLRPPRLVGTWRIIEAERSASSSQVRTISACGVLEHRSCDGGLLCCDDAGSPRCLGGRSRSSCVRFQLPRVQLARRSCRLAIPCLRWTCHLQPVPEQRPRERRAGAPPGPGRSSRGVDNCSWPFRRRPLSEKGWSGSGLGTPQDPEACVVPLCVDRCVFCVCIAFAPSRLEQFQEVD